MMLHSELFVVPGAQNIIRVLGAPNFVKGVKSTKLFEKCLGHYGTEVSPV